MSLLCVAVSLVWCNQSTHNLPISDLSTLYTDATMFQGKFTCTALQYAQHTRFGYSTDASWWSKMPFTHNSPFTRGLTRRPRVAFSIPSPWARLPRVLPLLPLPFGSYIHTGGSNMHSTLDASWWSKKPYMIHPLPEDYWLPPIAFSVLGYHLLRSPS